jgi:ribosome-binding protein aMBF1 (putative translation factor)
MIANERQYQVTRKKLAELRQLTESVARGKAGDPDFRDLQRDTLESQMADLRDEIVEYERLREGKTTTIEATSLAGLADALNKARIARGWTQADLARKLGVAGQQVQRDEATRYSGAALSRLCDVAEALQIDVRETITLRAS